MTCEQTPVTLEPFPAIEMIIASFTAGGIAAPPDRAVTSKGDWRHEVRSTFHQHMRCNTFHFHRKRDGLWNSHSTAAGCLQNGKTWHATGAEYSCMAALPPMSSCSWRREPSGFLFGGTNMTFCYTSNIADTVPPTYSQPPFLKLETNERTLIMPPLVLNKVTGM